jgi:hypothetical protein
MDNTGAIMDVSLKQIPHLQVSDSRSESICIPKHFPKQYSSGMTRVSSQVQNFRIISAHPVRMNCAQGGIANQNPVAECSATRKFSVTGYLIYFQ